MPPAPLTPLLSSSSSSPPLARQLKVITVAVLSEKFKIGGSLARRFLQEQQTAGKIKAVAPSSKMGVYTRAD
jgi:ribosomal protein S25